MLHLEYWWGSKVPGAEICLWRVKPRPCDEAIKKGSSRAHSGEAEGETQRVDSRCLCGLFPPFSEQWKSHLHQLLWGRYWWCGYYYIMHTCSSGDSLLFLNCLTSWIACASSVEWMREEQQVRLYQTEEKWWWSFLGSFSKKWSNDCYMIDFCMFGMKFQVKCFN